MPSRKMKTKSITGCQRDKNGLHICPTSMISKNSLSHSHISQQELDSESIQNKQDGEYWSVSSKCYLIYSEVYLAIVPYVLVLLPGPVFKLCLLFVVFSTNIKSLHDTGEARCNTMPNGENLEIQRQLSALNDMDTNLGMVNTIYSILLKS